MKFSALVTVYDQSKVEEAAAVAALDAATTAASDAHGAVIAGLVKVGGSAAIADPDGMTIDIYTLVPAEPPVDFLVTKVPADPEV